MYVFIGGNIKSNMADPKSSFSRATVLGQHYQLSKNSHPVFGKTWCVKNKYTLMCIITLIYLHCNKPESSTMKSHLQKSSAVGCQTPRWHFHSPCSLQHAESPLAWEVLVVAPVASSSWGRDLSLWLRWAVLGRTHPEIDSMSSRKKEQNVHPSTQPPCHLAEFYSHMRFSEWGNFPHSVFYLHLQKSTVRRHQDIWDFRWSLGSALRSWGNPKQTRNFLA